MNTKVRGERVEFRWGVDCPRKKSQQVMRYDVAERQRRRNVREAKRCICSEWRFAQVAHSSGGVSEELMRVNEASQGADLRKASHVELRHIKDEFHGESGPWHFLQLGGIVGRVI